MKREIEKRIERLELKTNLGIDVRAICTIYVTPGHIDRPVAGWSFGDWDNRVQVLREEGESDADLKQRAIALARTHIGPGKVPHLTSIG